MRICSDAYRFVVPLFALTVLSVYLHWYWLSILASILFLFVLSFFRDPEREIPSQPGLIVSPADGTVVRINSGAGDLPIQVSIFLSVFDVHVNRAPVAGQVENLERKKGKFQAAFHEAASIENEQNILHIVGENHRVKLVLIAGLIARRIVSWIRSGDHLERGQRIGLIRFGSRVDLCLPAGVELQIKKGDHVRGGASIIGRFT
jgi:phosphatidylserine decarboxylase